MKFSVLSLLLLANVVLGSSSAQSIANANVIQLTQQNYSSVIKADIPLIIDIYAPWCGACKMLSPVFDDMSDEFSGKVQFAKINYDSDHELAKKYDVMGLPTILFFKANETEPYMKVTGSLSHEEFREKISELLQ